MEEREECLIYLIGNKNDLDSKVRGNEVATQLGISYFEVSAKSGNGVNALFKKIAETIGNKIEHEDWLNYSNKTI